MSDESGNLSKRQRQRAATRGRRLATAERRRTMFELVVSGHSYEAIARETGLSPSALRRDVGKAIAARAIEAPERFVHLQVARIEKALLAADAAIERGDVRAVSQYLKVVAALARRLDLDEADQRIRDADRVIRPRLQMRQRRLADERQSSRREIVERRDFVE